MEDSKIKIIERFNNGLASEEEKNTMLKMFDDEEMDLSQLEVFELLSEKIDKQDFDMSMADSRFNDMLSEEIKKETIKEKKRNWFGYMPFGFKLALPILLLLMGFLMGRLWEVNQPEDMPIGSKVESNLLLADLLNHPSTSKRIQVVNNVHENLNNDQQVIRLLFLSLNNDRNDNVRMAAIDGLITYGDDPEVRENLINSIRNQTSPLVIQYLSEALQIIGEQVPIERYRSLYNKEIPTEVINQMELNLHTKKI